MRRFQPSLLLLVIITGLSLFLVNGIIPVITPESPVITETRSSSGLHAGFSAAPTSGRAPLMVQFVDLSNGNPVTWNWDFGDEYSSQEENPIHTYQRGVYSVKLTVYDQDGESDTAVKEQYISAHPLPLDAYFTANPVFLVQLLSPSSSPIVLLERWSGSGTSGMVQ